MSSLKIVGYSPYNQWMLHGLWHITMLHGLRLRGNDVKYVLCDGLYQACDMHRSKLPRNEMSCYKCQKIVSEQACDLRMPFEWLGRYIYPSEILTAEKWCHEFDSSNFFQARYDHWEIGSWIKSSIHTHFRIPYPDLSDPKIAETVRMYLSSGLIACFALNRLMDDYAPDILLLFNGRMSSTRIALELALKRGIQVFTHERGTLKESLTLWKNTSCSSYYLVRKALNEWENIPLSKKEAIEIKAFLNDKMHGKSQNWVNHSPPPENIESLRKKMNLPSNNRQLFVLFNSSDDEIIASVDEPGPFKKQIDWIMQTIAFARLHPEIDVVLRVHPNIAGKKAAMGNNFQQLHEILDLKPIIPLNVRLIMPDDPISSYTLMSMADVGLVYRSTAGLEMACQGKPVVVADNCILSDQPFLLTAKSPEHYNEILSSFLGKKTKEINPETIRMAHRFAYTLFSRKSIPFPLVKMTNTFKGKVVYDSVDDLLPGKNPYLDRVMRIILEDEDIIPSPTVKDKKRSTKYEDAILAGSNADHTDDNSFDNVDDHDFELMKHLKNKAWNNKFPVYSKKFQYVKFFNKNVQPKISIVVVSWRLHPDTIKNFEILQQQRKQNFELIFVNNGADDEEFKTLEPFIDTYVKLNDNTGPCFARNLGAVFAKAPIVCFLEDDGIPEKNFVAAHLQAFKKYDIIGLRGVYRPKTDTPINQKAHHYYMGDRPFPAIINLEGNASFKSKPFFQAGGWDEDIFIMGDGLALSMRLLQVEPDLKKQIYYPEAVIYHDYARDEEHLKKKMAQLDKSMAIIRGKYKNYDCVRKIWNSFQNKNDNPITTDKLIRAGDFQRLNQDNISVNWVLTRRCNYSCSYCTVKNNKNDFINFEKLKIAANNISNLKNKKITITLTGGEPTIHPDYLDLLEYIMSLKDDRIVVNTLTNLSLPLSFYKKIVSSEIIDKSKINFGLSYHFEYAKPDKFIANAKYLAEHRINSSLRLIADPKYMQDVKALYEAFKKYNSTYLSIDIKLVRENFGNIPDKGYTEADLAWLSSFYNESESKSILHETIDNITNNKKRTYFTSNDVISKGLNKYKEMICHAGENMMSIDEHGNVAPAVCFRKNKKNGINIFNPDIKLSELNKPVICPFEACGCLADIPLPKYLPGYQPADSDLKSISHESLYPINSSKEFDHRKLLQHVEEIGWEKKSEIYSQYFESVSQINKIDKPTISIIVISWRLHPDTIKNFQILEKQRDQNFELIFVDNGGKLGEFDELKTYIDTYIRLNTNTGAYLARNIGAVFAKAPILFFLEDDGIPAGNIVQAHLDAHDKYDVIAVRGVYQPKTNNPLNQIAKHYYLGPKPFPIYADLEGNTSYSARHFFKVGGWDDEIRFGGGGVDLSRRLIEVEPDLRKQIYSPVPVILHDYAKNQEHFEQKRAKQKESHARLRVKHPDYDKFLSIWKPFAGDDEILIKMNKKKYDFSINNEISKLITDIYTNPFISICIPTYNRGHFILDAVYSALNQTYQKFEVIIVDDGSTDKTETLLKKIDNNKIKYKQKIHSGAPNTRNQCISESKGEFILWLDSDDIIHKNLLCEYVGMLNKLHDIDILYSNHYCVDTNGYIVNKYTHYEWYNNNYEMIIRFLTKNPLPNPGTLVRKRIYDELGGYDSQFPRAHDMEFWSRVALSNKYSCKYVDKFLNFIRIHNDNITGIKNPIKTNFIHESQITKNIISGLGLEEIVRYFKLNKKYSKQQVFVKIIDRFLELYAFQDVDQFYRQYSPGYENYSIISQRMSLLQEYMSDFILHYNIFTFIMSIKPSNIISDYLSFVSSKIEFIDLSKNINIIDKHKAECILNEQARKYFEKKDYYISLYLYHGLHHFDENNIDLMKIISSLYIMLNDYHNSIKFLSKSLKIDHNDQEVITQLDKVKNILDSRNKINIFY
ncbi:Glycosyltransferase involved in cell wall bisynthesis [Desulfonatronum thiosulfatophilum]|uniref:Glycosyltransferase involved in cell wall bisynthesis n=1 Tax=Desulfonatronum thiosulfatophilum TaxID=617002 RepID=A0A1G6DUR8_9BACT|nr:glycosyltransferase [Desulfonatronum thiosulfatophilum]SDB48924.1 Glycosyltransferase involved in cell wall bisynthesis [Desulfonatronum thiosulfatophilum]